MGELEKVQAHVTVVRAFNGAQDRVFTFVWPDVFPHGSDATITFLLLALSMLVLPATCTTLYLWGDNCGRENKNRFVLAFAYVLVHLGIFRKVKLNFLPKGHTHDWTCDGVFGHFWRKLSRQNVFTIPKMIEVLEQSYTPKPEVIYVTRIASFSTLFLLHLERDVDGHTMPRSFKISRESDGTITHKYRLQCATSKRGSKASPWLPEGRGYNLFPNLYPDLANLVCVPQKVPDMLPLKATIKAYQLLMTAADIAWWDDFFAFLQAPVARQCVDCNTLRAEMVTNAQSKKDAPEVARVKGRKLRLAYKAMQTHLQIRNPAHPAYVMPALPTMASRVQQVEVPLGRDDAALLQQLQDQRVEGIECHFVGAGAKVRGARVRAAKRRGEFTEINVTEGMFCVILGDAADAPWWVGFIVKVHLAEDVDARGSRRVLSLSVHECGSEAVQGSCPSSATWRKAYRKSTSDGEAVDQFTAGRQDAGFRPLITEREVSSLITCGPESKILTSTHRVKDAILKMLHVSEEVKWVHPNPPLSWLQGRSLGNAQQNVALVGET